MNTKQCPKCKYMAHDKLASCRICGAEFNLIRPTTPEPKEELHPAIAALEQLYTASGQLRLRCKTQAPKLQAFSEWDSHTKAMQTAENIINNK